MDTHETELANTSGITDDTSLLLAMMAIFLSALAMTMIIAAATIYFTV